MTIHSLLVLSTIFDNALFINKPHSSTLCEISFENSTEKWTSMKEISFGGVQYYTTSINPAEYIVRFKIRYYTNGLRRDSSVQSVVNTNSYLKLQSNNTSLLIISSINLFLLSCIAALSVYKIFAS